MALDNDLCLVFGNLIENAIEACRRMDTSDSLNEKSSHFIRLHAHVHYKTLIITMDNSFDGHVTIQNGKYRSSKMDDYGIGLSSIRSVAGKYDGDVAFEAMMVYFSHQYTFKYINDTLKSLIYINASYLNFIFRAQLTYCI